MEILKHIKEFGPTSWAIRNRTSVYVMTILMTLAGLIVYVNIPKEQFPDIVIPTIVVSTIYPPGSNPADIENLITKPIEDQLKSVSGIRKVTSNSIPNFSLVMVEFNPDVATNVAKVRVQDAVDKAKNDLPTDLDKDPGIQEVNFSEFPIMQVNIAGEIPLMQLNYYAEQLEDRIEGLKEITRADLIGAPKREVQINMDLFKMQAAGITFVDVERAIQAQNVNISGGELRVGDLRRTIRVIGQFKDAKEMEGVLVRSTIGNKAYLRDIAEVKDTYEEKQDFARLDGKTVITLNIIKRAGENLISASDKIHEICDEFTAKRLPPGVKITVTGDTADKTKVQLNDLVNTVIIGFILVLFVLMFFMGLRSAFFVALAVPLSALLAFLFMPSLGFTLNVIVVFSLLLALGIIVDDAIVVIENTHRIYHHYDVDIKTAAKAAAGEVFIPVLAGTLTTIAPFVPLLFWPGLVGQFMKYLPITLIITLFASLLVAFIMNPVFAVDTVSKNKGPQKRNWKTGILVPMTIFLALGLIGKMMGSLVFANLSFFLVFMTPINYFVLNPAATYFQNHFWPKLINGYRWLISGLIRYPGMTFLGAIGLLFLSLFIFVASNPQTTFFPQADPNFANVYIKLPVGTDGNVTDSITRIVEERVYEVIGRDNPSVNSVITNVGIGAGDPRDPDRVVTPHKSKVAVAFVEFEHRHGYNTREALNKIRENLRDIPAAEISVEKEPSGPPTGKPVNIEITGEDYEIIAKIQDTLSLLIAESGIKGIEDLRSSLVLNKPEVVVNIDAEKAQAEGLSKAQIAMEIRTALFGKEISKFRDVDDDAPIMLRLAKEYRGKLDYMLNMNMGYLDMSIGTFRSVPISTFATVEYKNSMTGINHKRYQRVVTLSSNVIEGYNANDIVKQINKIIATLKLPDGYTVKMTGEQEDQQETIVFLMLAFPAALLLMYLIMVTQFNSVVKPAIIFFTVIFSMIGVFLGYAATGMAFSAVMSGVGVFSLAGIVIRNGILLLEFTDELQHRGVPIRESIIEAGATRLTPVFLTAICAILGLIPLAIGLNINFTTLLTDFDPHFFLGGDNVAFWGPLAWTMIFGLTVATFLTLLVVPCMLYMYLRFRAWAVSKIRGNKTEEPVAEQEEEGDAPIEEEEA